MWGYRDAADAITAGFTTPSPRHMRANACSMLLYASVEKAKVMPLVRCQHDGRTKTGRSCRMGK
jgi:hypothetical protein